MAFWAAIPAIASIASSVYGMVKGGNKGGGGVSETPDKEKWQLELGNQLKDWASKYISSYVPGEAYTGKMVSATPTGEESKGLSYLNSFMNKGFGNMGQLAEQELKNTLTNKYDPYNSAYYQSMRTGQQAELQDSIDVMRRGQGSRGTYFQDTSMREENKLRERGTNYLNQLLGNMAENERARRFSAVEPAMGIEKYQSGLDLEKAKAGLGYGSLQRTLENQDLEAKYNEFKRQRGELTKPLDVASSLFGSNMNYSVKDYQPPQGASTFERIMSGLPGLIQQGQNAWGSIFN